MTEYSITLSKSVGTPKLLLQGLTRSKFWRNSLDIFNALRVFDKNNNEIVNYEEMMDAYDYFLKKENEIAVTGKKGDHVITSEDIEQIIKTDSKFDAIRGKYNDDKKVVDILSRTLMTLSALLTKFAGKKVGRIEPDVILSNHVFFSIDKCVDNTQISVKEIDGKKVQIYSKNGEKSVRSADGKYVYTNPAFVAKCLGYESESTWFGLGPDKYYEKSRVTSRFARINYKTWNEDSNSFISGEWENKDDFFNIAFNIK